ncbi:MAG: hypothetical protein C0507_17185 [Cyanobacteria bacterium PR.3.49]|nr:hypothetical protein [Cyanobacteria bacterium PR.3.49]
MRILSPKPTVQIPVCHSKPYICAGAADWTFLKKIWRILGGRGEGAIPTEDEAAFVRQGFYAARPVQLSLVILKLEEIMVPQP